MPCSLQRAPLLTCSGACRCLAAHHDIDWLSAIWLKTKAMLNAHDAAFFMACKGWHRGGHAHILGSTAMQDVYNIWCLDVFRKFHPNRLKSYTVWNMKTNARPRNHGSRVDFILAASGQKAQASSNSSRDTPDKVRPNPPDNIY